MTWLRCTGAGDDAAAAAADLGASAPARAGVLAYALTPPDSVYRMAFNGLFLVHVATFSVALFALIFVSATIDVARLLVGSSSFSSCRGVAAS